MIVVYFVLSLIAGYLAAVGLFFLVVWAMERRRDR